MTRVAAGALSDGAIKDRRQITVTGLLDAVRPCPGGAEVVVEVRVPVAEWVEVGRA